MFKGKSQPGLWINHKHVTVIGLQFWVDHISQWVKLNSKCSQFAKSHCKHGNSWLSILNQELQWKVHLVDQVILAEGLKLLLHVHLMQKGPVFNVHYHRVDADTSLITENIEKKKKRSLSGSALIPLVFFSLSKQISLCWLPLGDEKVVFEFRYKSHKCVFPQWSKHGIQRKGKYPKLSVNDCEFVWCT